MIINVMVVLSEPDHEIGGEFIRFDDVLGPAGTADPVPSDNGPLQANVIRVPPKKCPPGSRKDRHNQCRKIY